MRVAGTHRVPYEDTGVEARRALTLTIAVKPFDDCPGASAYELGPSGRALVWIFQRERAWVTGSALLDLLWLHSLR